MKFLLLAFLLLSSFPTQSANAASSYSKFLRGIQQKYLRNVAPYPILIMDRDELEWRFASRGATESEDLREMIIREYVKEKTGIWISENAATNFEPYLTVLKDMAVAMPALSDDFSGKILMCAVFPADPNRNQRLETERLLQLQVEEAYGRLGFEQLTSTMEYEDLILTSVLHEAGHCLDQTYFRAAVTLGQSDPHTVHMSESFAETTAILLLAKEEKTDLAEKRAALRSVYTYYMQPYFSAHPENGFGMDTYTYGGLIYFLAPSIRAAGTEVKARTAEIQGMDMPEILLLAKEIVDRSAFDSRVLTAIHATYSEGREAAIARYRRYAADMPDLFADTYGKMLSFLEEMDRTKATFFDSDRPDPPASGKPLLEIPFERMCAQFQANDVPALLEEIEALRRDLRASRLGAEIERARSAALRDLWKELPAKCVR